MKKTILIFMGLFLLVGCSSTGGSTDKGDAQAQLSVSSVPGRLKAKLVMKNESGKELVFTDLNPKYFKVEMVNGKAMAYKGPGQSTEALTVKPGAMAETAFSLQDSYAFWDRRTKYKIWYDSPSLKSNAVQVWF
ncbi:MAG: hypothetical protein KF799_11170 [Bdellovibrionales bacterium]|nr:hypothetical protein [Bdellovibrionales bacterium]